MAKKAIARRRPRVVPTPAAERIIRKGTRALESALDAVADNPEESLQKAGAFVGRLLDVLESSGKAYREDPEGTKREIKNMAIGALASLGKKKRKRIR
jgi:hypothetical protein